MRILEAAHGSFLDAECTQPFIMDGLDEILPLEGDQVGTFGADPLVAVPLADGRTLFVPATKVG